MHHLKLNKTTLSALLLLLVVSFDASAAYQCETINQSTNVCDAWVQVGFLGLPEITEQQAGELITAVLGLWAIALGGVFVVRSLFSKK